MDANIKKGVSPHVRIVLADDHVVTLDHVKKLLYGRFEVVEAVHDGPSLLDAVTRLNPDVAVVDITMPGLTGLEVTRELRRRACPVAILILTANDDPDMAQLAINLGALGYVVKTHMVSELVPAIEEVLNGRKFISAGVCHED